MSNPIDAVELETRAWVRRAVVGLNLCPFAKAPMVKDQIRYVVSAADDASSLLEALCAEMHVLANAPPEQIETTLLIHPNVLGDFEAFNDFLDVAEGSVEELGYAGVLQVASFHPQYRFAGTDIDDVSNATNRSPYPTLHLLREESIDRAVIAFPQAEAIFEANIRTLENLGTRGWDELLEQCRIEGSSS